MSVFSKEELTEVLDRTYRNMFKSIAHTQVLLEADPFEVDVEKCVRDSMMMAWIWQTEYRKVFKGEKDVDQRN